MAFPDPGPGAARLEMEDGIPLALSQLGTRLPSVSSLRVRVRAPHP